VSDKAWEQQEEMARLGFLLRFFDPARVVAMSVVDGKIFVEIPRTASDVKRVMSEALAGRLGRMACLGLALGVAGGCISHVLAFADAFSVLQ